MQMFAMLLKSLMVADTLEQVVARQKATIKKFFIVQNEGGREVSRSVVHYNLQMIIAAPPDKIQYIGPAMKKVLLVLQDDKLSYVEDFSREAV